MDTNTFDSFISRLLAFANVSGGDTLSGFTSLALGLFARQFEGVSPYRRFCESLGKTPRSVTSASEIPCVPTSAFKDLEFSSLALSERTSVFHSSGTTEHRPSRHYHSPTTLDLYQRLLLPWFRTHLLPDRERLPLLSLVPSSSTAPTSSLAHMVDTVIRDCGAQPVYRTAQISASTQGTWELDLPKTLEALHRLTDQPEPVLVLGTAYGFVHLFEGLEQRSQSFRLPSGSRVMETGGYKGRSRSLAKDELYRRLHSALGVAESHIVSEYGMSELSSQAYDRPVGSSQPRVFRFPPWCMAYVTDPESGRPADPGKSGLLRVLDLANVRSVLAVQTEDLAVACGDGFNLMGRAQAAEARGCSLRQA